MQTSIAAVDTCYDVASANPASFSFPDLSSNAHGASSHFELPEESGRTDATLPNLDSVHLPKSMPTRLPSAGSGLQYAIQGSIRPLVSDYSTMQQSLTDSQYRPGTDPIQSVSTVSSSQNERPVQNSEMNIIRKRPRSAEPTNAKRLTDARRQLAKRIRVPENSLSVMCFDTESQPKRSRTSSQKQNKKDVENVGGSCLLCFIDKKKVFF